MHLLLTYDDLQSLGQLLPLPGVELRECRRAADGALELRLQIDPAALKQLGHEIPLSRPFEVVLDLELGAEPGAIVRLRLRKFSLEGVPGAFLLRPLLSPSFIFNQLARQMPETDGLKVLKQDQTILCDLNVLLRRRVPALPALELTRLELTETGLELQLHFSKP